MSHPYPNFLVVGMMKAATTTLYDHIAKHDMVVKAYAKELHYFSRDFVRVSNSEFWGYEYYELLNYRPGTPYLYGEASPSYIAVADRIHRFNPDCRIIISLRDPVDRMLSQYRQYSEHGLETEAPEIALTRPGNRYMTDSLYAVRVEHFLKKFVPANVLLVSMEYLSANPQDAVGRLYGFLGLDAIPVTPTKLNVSSVDDANLSELRARLRLLLEPARGALSALIDRYRPQIIPGEVGAFRDY